MRWIDDFQGFSVSISISIGSEYYLVIHGSFNLQPQFQSTACRNQVHYKRASFEIHPRRVFLDREILKLMSTTTLVNIISPINPIMFSTGAIRPTSRHISRLRSRSRQVHREAMHSKERANSLQFSSRSSQLQSSLKFSKRPHLSHSSFQIVTPSSIRLKSTWNPFAWGWAEPHKDAAPPTYEVPLATPTHDPTVPSIESVKNAAEPATAAPTGHMFESLPAGDTLGGQDLYEQLSTMAVNHVEPHIGFLKEAGLDFGWGPSSMIQWLIENVHVYGGMPWYGTLITCAVITRVLLLYPAMVTADQGARMGYFSKEAKEASDEMKATVMAGGDQNQATQVFTTKVTRLKHEYGFEGTKFAASLFLQIPIGFATFRVLRNLSETPGLGLASEGALWFQDLTVTDPTFILPVLMAGSMAAFMRVRDNLIIR